jgi:hypothetical protein
MKGAERICWRSGPSKRAKEHLASSIERLALYCRSPRARAKRATDFDLHEETKQYTTHWPSHELLKSIEDDVRTLTLLARNKWPRGVPWQAFQLVDKHLPALLLVLRVNDLVDRARKRLTQAGLSKLEKLLRNRGRLPATYFAILSESGTTPATPKQLIGRNIRQCFGVMALNLIVATRQQCL